MCLDWLCSKLCQKWNEYPQIPPPQGLVPIDFSELYTLLRSEFEYTAIYMADNNYKTCSIQELQRFLKDDITDSWQYVPEYWDCDDASFSLMGRLSNPDWGMLPFGVMYVVIEEDENSKVAGHAVNIFVDKNRNILIIEPQNDQIMLLPDNWRPYLIVM